MSKDKMQNFKEDLIQVFLDAENPLTYSDIEQELDEYNMPEGYLTKVLKSLESNGMVEVSEKDGAKSYLLTHLGKRRFEVIEKRNEVQKRERTRKIVIGSVLAAILLAALVWLIFFIGNGNSQKTPEKEETPISEKVDENLPEPIGSTDTSTFEKLSLAEEDTKKGSLILVNNDHSYSEEISDLVNISEKKNDLYTVTSSDLEVRKVVVEKLNDLVTAYNKATEKEDIRVGGGYRSAEEQAEIYNEYASESGEEYASSIAAKGGCSDKQAGYSVDLYKYEDGDRVSIKDTDIEKWLKDNAADYGFILRFPVGKKLLTGFELPQSYRYVGKVHATYISQNGLCLEEYIDLLKTKYFSEKTPLEVTCNDGTYNVYYAAGTEINVPTTRDYEVSGDNAGGFVVSYKIS